jgi:hypothetical protein
LAFTIPSDTRSRGVGVGGRSDARPFYLHSPVRHRFVPKYGSMWAWKARVFELAQFRQGTETFTYEYDRVQLGPQPDSAFRRPPVTQGIAR